MLSQELIDKFRKLYLDHFGIKLSDKEAQFKATAFLNMMKIIHRPLPKKQDTDNN